MWDTSFKSLDDIYVFFLSFPKRERHGEDRTDFWYDLIRSININLSPINKIFKFTSNKDNSLIL